MRKVIETGGMPELVIECKADLEIEGLPEGELGVEIHSDDERASVVTDGNRIVISAEDDTEVRAPCDAVIYVAAVGGDLEVEGFSRLVNIGHVGGDLDVEEVGGLEVHSVSGDCKLEAVAGPVSIRAVGGDLQADAIAFAGQAVSSISVGGDVSLRLLPDTDSFSVRAGGDVALALPAEAGIVVHIADSKGIRRVRFGDGAVAVKVSAGGEASVVGDGEATPSVEPEAGTDWADAMRDVERELNELQRNIEHMAREFGQRFTGMPAWKIERAQRQAEAAARKMEARLRRHLRYLEERARREAERAAARAARAARRSRAGWAPVPTPPAPPWPSPTTPPAPSWDPSSMPFEAPPKRVTTDEERIMILRMVQEKKITVEQAEQLLAALEG
ncbi:MAG: hypothetical protein K6U78_17185 [Anaerolineae bacterium]|nr:hypothetical protein [Anaerolineae bacterium]